MEAGPPIAVRYRLIDRDTEPVLTAAAFGSRQASIEPGLKIIP